MGRKIKVSIKTFFHGYTHDSSLAPWFFIVIVFFGKVAAELATTLPGQSLCL